MAGNNFDKWRIHDYAHKFTLDPTKYKDNVERIDVSKCSHDTFVEKFEKIYKPVVITGATKDWKATAKWTPSVSLQYIYNI